MEAISTSAIDKVLSIGPARVLEIDGYKYIDKGGDAKRFTPPVPDTLTVHTLTGLVGLLEIGFEGFRPGECIVQVDAFDEVSLLAKTSDVYGRRQVFAKAKALRPERPFTFDDYHQQETFVIALMSQFVQTPELESLLKLAGNLAAQSEIRQEDDGFTQRVATKQGVHKLGESTVNPRITLQPYRTFLDVEQPKSDFVFRVKAVEGRGNMCALFGADGGYWKQNAMFTVQTWLQNQLRGSSDENLNSMTVIA